MSTRCELARTEQMTDLEKEKEMTTAEQVRKDKVKFTNIKEES